MQITGLSSVFQHMASATGATSSAQPSASNGPAETDEAKGKSSATNDERALSRSEQQAQLLEQAEIDKLVRRDREVRTHEQAHAAVGGTYAGAPSYTYTRGPDGKNYVTAGEVSIDTSVIPGDPQATIAKMQQVRRAALAPVQPSGQDRMVAAQAQAKIIQAQAELAASRGESAESPSSSGTRSEAAIARYQAVSTDSAESRNHLFVTA